MYLHRFDINNDTETDFHGMNENFTLLENKVTGRLVKDVSEQSSVTLTKEEASNTQLVFTGALTEDVSIIVPTTPSVFVVQNRTTGNHTLTLRTANGSGIIIQQANLPNHPRIKRVLCDGTDITWADGSQIVEDNLHEATPTHGYYVRYANGVQVCYKNVVVTVDVNVAWGSMYLSPASSTQLGQFAQPFLVGTAPSISIDLIGGNDGILSTLRGVTNTDIGTVRIARGTSLTDAGYTISVTAIGRWK